MMYDDDYRSRRFFWGLALHVVAYAVVFFAAMHLAGYMLEYTREAMTR